MHYNNSDKNGEADYVLALQGHSKQICSGQAKTWPAWPLATALPCVLDQLVWKLCFLFIISGQQTVLGLPSGVTLAFAATLPPVYYQKNKLCARKSSLLIAIVYSPVAVSNVEVHLERILYLHVCAYCIHL